GELVAIFGATIAVLVATLMLRFAPLHICMAASVCYPLVTGHPDIDLRPILRRLVDWPPFRRWRAGCGGGKRHIEIIKTAIAFVRFFLHDGTAAGVFCFVDYMRVVIFPGGNLNRLLAFRLCRLGRAGCGATVPRAN